MAADQELGLDSLMSPPSPTPSDQSDQSAASDPSPTTMDLQAPDSPCRLKLTRREGEWEVVQPQNFPPLPDSIPPLKLSRRNRRWAIDGRASKKRPAPSTAHRQQPQRSSRLATKRHLPFHSPPSADEQKRARCEAVDLVCLFAG